MSQYDAGIILGGGRYDEETLTPLSLMRLDVGWNLYQRGIIPKIILPGDNYSTYHPRAVKFDKSTAQVRKEYLLKKGNVNTDDIIIAYGGRDTIDEAFAVRRKLVNTGLNKLLLITSERHMPRALFIFQIIFGDSATILEKEESNVKTGDILLIEEEREYLEVTKEFFKQMPEVIPDPGDSDRWYKENADIYKKFSKIQAKYHPRGKESQAYTLGKR